MGNSKTGDIHQKVEVRVQLGKYRPDYCGLLILHMGKGKSFKSFAGAIGVTRNTLYQWKRSIPDFADAVDIAWSKAMLYWETQLDEGARGEIKANASLMIFKLKNMFPNDYVDKQEIVNKHVMPTSISFNTGIVRPGDNLIEDSPPIETIDYKEIDNGEDLL